MKKDLQKKLGFILLVMAVFFAGVALTVFSSSVPVVCIAGALLLIAAIFYVLPQEEEQQKLTDKTTEVLFGDRMAEMMRGNEKAEKGVYIAVKKQHEAMEAGLASLEEKLDELVKAQETAVKTLVMYNKENAKQIALSEREELTRLREELQQGDKGQGSGSVTAMVDAIKEMSSRLYNELHENGEAMLSELETTADCLDEIKESFKNMSVSAPVNQVETTYDNTALFEQTSVAEEEPEEEKEPEDAFASSGVDLSDPNRTLSADDIAALIASMGN